MHQIDSYFTAQVQLKVRYTASFYLKHFIQRQRHQLTSRFFLSYRYIYRNRNNVIKSALYNTLRHRGSNTLTLRNKAEHAARRRVVSSRFSDASLRLLEPKILAQVHRLIRGLLSAGATPLNSETQPKWTDSRDMALWCEYYECEFHRARHV